MLIQRSLTLTAIMIDQFGSGMNRFQEQILVHYHLSNVLFYLPYCLTTCLKHLVMFMTSLLGRLLGEIRIRSLSQMALIWKILVLSYFGISVCRADSTQVHRKNIFLNRKKRYLSFPPGSNLAVSFTRIY